MGPLSALVLAAGRARRFGADKLLRPFKGEPLLMHAVASARAAPVDRIVIVKRAGLEIDQHCRAVMAIDARVTHVDIESEALSISLHAGLDAIGAGVGVFVFLGDMPLIPPHVPAMLADRIGDRLAAVPTCEGRPGHPVLLSVRAAILARAISGDQGAGALLRAHASEVVQIETHDQGVVLDIDTPQDLERLAASATNQQKRS